MSLENKELTVSQTLLLKGFERTNEVSTTEDGGVLTKNYWVHPKGMFVCIWEGEKGPKKYEVRGVFSNAALLILNDFEAHYDIQMHSNMEGEVLGIAKINGKFSRGKTEDLGVLNVKIDVLQAALESVGGQNYFSLEELKKNPAGIFNEYNSSIDWIYETKGRSSFRTGACRMTRDYIVLGWEKPNKKTRERYLNWHKAFILESEKIKSIVGAGKAFEVNEGLPFEAWALRFVNDSQDACWILYEIKERSSEEKKKLFDYVFPNGQSFAHAFCEWVSLTLLRWNDSLSEVYAQELKEILEDVNVEDIKIDSPTFKPLKELQTNGITSCWKYSAYDACFFDPKVWKILYELNVQMELPDDKEYLFKTQNQSELKTYLSYLDALEKEKALNKNIKAVPPLPHKVNKKAGMDRF